jgi:histidyl-tRNA synthetase
LRRSSSSHEAYCVFKTKVTTFYVEKFANSLIDGSMTTVQALSGFREFYPEDCALRNFIFERFRKTAVAFGFEEYDAPILEPTELFTTKSGEEITAQLFNFEDKGGRQVAMRPEMTPSLARMVGEHANTMKKPIKWFSIAEAFRYERPQKGRLRSFYQFNADLLGDDTLQADAEVIALGIQALKNFRLTSDDFRVRLSDRRLWGLFIESCGVQLNNIPAVLSIIDKIEREDEDKIVAKLNNISGINGKRLLDDILKLKNIRSLDEMVNFFSKRGTLSTEIDGRIVDFSHLLGKLEAFGMLDFISIDFGIVRGLAYYTGFVFEIFEYSGQSRALAGGGRYDNLVEKLGYSSLPAVGFANGDVTLGNLLRDKNLLPRSYKKVQCFCVYCESTETKAMQQISLLRGEGINTDYCLHPTGFAKQMKMAAQLGAKYVAIFGEDEVKINRVKLKNMATGEEKLVEIGQISKMLVE